MAIDHSSDREDIALTTSELDDVLSSAELSGEIGEAKEPGLEKYGIWIKVEPETLESMPETEEAFELAELEAETGGEAEREAKLTAEEEQLLGELEAESASESGSFEPADFESLEKDLKQLSRTAPAAETEEELTVADLDVGMEELAGEPLESEIEVPLSEKMPELDTLEEAAEEARAEAAARPKSEEILRKIEQDLNQIKSEIQNLKKELAGIARGGAGAVEAQAPQGPTAAPGFLAEEEDDSIALTGDELDNILNTADITEEKAQVQETGPEEELAPIEAEAAPLFEAEAGEEAEIIEPGSLSTAAEEMASAAEQPEPEAVELDLEELERPAPAEEAPEDLETLTEAVSAEAPEAPEAEELLLEDLGEVAEEETLPESLSLEEAAAPPEELTLEDFSGVEEPTAARQASAAESRAEEQLPIMESAEEPELVEDLEAPESAEVLEAEPLGAEALEAEPLEAETAEAEALEAEPLEAEPLEAEPLGFETAEPEPKAAPAVKAEQPAEGSLPSNLREDVRSVLSYLDQLLEALPDDKIRQFAQSEYFGVYKRLFEELGLGA